MRKHHIVGTASLLAGILTVLLLSSIVRCAAAPATITVRADQPGHAISPLLYGIFFEDINCSADGGLYAELVRNRNFEDSDKPVYWSSVNEGGRSASIEIDRQAPLAPENPRSLKLSISGSGNGRAGVANEGFWGMGITKGETYDLHVFAKASQGFHGTISASLEGKDGTVLARQALPALGPDWKPYSITFKPKTTEPQARLVLTTDAEGVFWLDMVSLFPHRTWKSRPNGLRPDLAAMISDLKPAFVRFPGGCWVEGDTMATAYRWKQTIGDTSKRRTQHNIWQYEATHGIGYHEYLQFCEDLNAEPLFVINCGMSHKEVVPREKMDEFVQDALDAIEYANGPSTSTWGAVRAKNGHPAPFHLRYMEIGNENGGPAYQERFALFHDAIKAKYPDMHLVANDWGGTPQNRPVEIVDEHYYSTPEFFIHNFGKYDSYNRGGRKVYVGEYAVTQGCGEGNLRAAVGESVFMMGMERNSDVVVMSSYAPLFANVNYKKWNPDLINFDSARAYGLPSYYVQQMFSRNRGDFVLPVTVVADEVAPAVKTGGIGVGTWRTEVEFKDLKVARGNGILFQTDFASTNGWRFHDGQWSMQEGALRQKALGENIRAFFGDRSWSNYTYSLKARKLSGAEGFLIPFLVQDENAKAWWNIGGWNNSRHAIEMDGVEEKSVPGQIETGRWYDIRIEVAGTDIKCFLDDRLIHHVQARPTKQLYATASGLSSGREIILKVANVSTEPLETEIKLEGMRSAGAVDQLTLTSPNSVDENTLQQPTRVSPKRSREDCQGSGFKHVFPANSVTVMRIAKTK